MRLAWRINLVCALWMLTGLAAAAEFPVFEEVVLDPNIGKVCYAVTAADVNGDGKLDAVALSENRLVWFENPTWTPHVILENQLELDHVCLDPYDIDGDGKIDFAVGAGWTKVGTIQWVARDPDNPDGLWNVYPISVEPWTHRMRFADVLGRSKPQLVVSPLNKTQGDGVRLLAFSIPENPRADRWPTAVLDDAKNRMHNHWHADVFGTGRLDTLTASEEGIFAIIRDGEEFRQTAIAKGATGEKPTDNGAGEIKFGTLGDGKRLIAAIGPMHGNQLLVYRSDTDDRREWSRLVLDDTLGRGHALWLADVDGDGQDEIVLGHSDPASGEIKGPGVFIYDADDAEGSTWTKRIVDNGGMATEDLVCADFDGDGRIDILAGGRNTHNVKLYLNRGPKR